MGLGLWHKLQGGIHNPNLPTPANSCQAAKRRAKSADVVASRGLEPHSAHLARLFELEAELEAVAPFEVIIKT